MKTAFRLEVRRARNLVFWLVVITVAYAGTMAIFWPVMHDNAALIGQYMDVFPKGFLAAFGMDGSLADPGVFFTTYVGSWLWPILAALAAIVLATRPVAVDLERGFLELPLATRLPRAHYLIASIAAQALALAILALTTVLGFWAAARLVGAPYDLASMILVALLAWAFACAIAGVTSILAVITLSRAIAGGLVAAALLAMYLLDVIAKMQPNLDFLGWLSAMHYFRTTPIIDHGLVPVGELGLFAIIGALGWALAVVAFRRRDLAA
ncbi:MAG: ABC transporter permease subunit [Candidatus Limnocylindrales bacterium]